MIYITGDMHGNVVQMQNVMRKIECKPKNTLVILGDFGAIYYFGKKDNIFKQAVCDYNIPIFAIRGNHDGNPADVADIKEAKRYGNVGYIQPQFPNIFYAKNGLTYTIENTNFLVLGGAYSVDKYYRLSKGYKWFSDEQMTIPEKEAFWANKPTAVDVILSHTCPYSDMPRHLFLRNIPQDTVDNSMEYFLEDVKNEVGYKYWFFGHYHDNERVWDNMYMLYNGVVQFNMNKEMEIE